MKNYSYVTHGVCSTSVCFDIENGKLYNLKFNGGCVGNLQAIAKLVEGKPAQEVANILRGNDCRGKGTSCADQLSKAIDWALNVNENVA
ncbi:MAG: TIGR03905 family TSCPD domain-containing protein [Alphaproteobacteria bacterium]|nr:TIGR03905 family TSCPD domain-containing protein [Alphaproteobacteria bacterium]